MFSRALLLTLIGCATATAQTVEVMSRADPPTALDTGTASSVVWSADGSRVLVFSDAADLPGLPNPGRRYGAYVFDMVSETLSLVAYEAVSGVLSSDGRVVVLKVFGHFFPGGPFDSQVVAIDRSTGAISLVSHAAGDPSMPANRQSTAVAVSHDGRFVLFNSHATDLVEGQLDSFDTEDVFLHDVSSGETVLVSGTGTQAFGYASHGDGLTPDGGFAVLVAYQPPMLFASQVYLYERQAGTLTLVSHAFGSSLPTLGHSVRPRLSADAAWVAFDSDAPALLPGLPNPLTRSVFLYERATGGVSLVSQAAGSPGVPANDQSLAGAISADGTLLAYSSRATDLVPGQVDGNGGDDVFLFDRVLGTTSLASRLAGSAATSGNGACTPASVSLAGGRVAFESLATDLVTGQADANGEGDLFVFDAASGETRLASHVSGSPAATGDRGVSGGALGPTGWRAAFLSPAADLAGPGDGDQAADAFGVHLATTETRNLTAADPSALRRTGDSDSVIGSIGIGAVARRQVSGDGRYVAFVSNATDLVAGQADQAFTPDVFLFEQASGAVTLVSRSPGSPTAAVGGDEPAISPDGRFVAFTSQADDVVAGQVDTNLGRDVFLFDRVSGLNVLVSHVPGSPTMAGNSISNGRPSLSGDGGSVAFESRASDLVPGQSDSALSDDVFLYDRASGAVTLVSHISASDTGAASGEAPTISADGRFVTFQSTGTGLVSGQVDVQGTFDVFLHDLQTGETTLVSHVPGSAVTTGNNISLPAVLSADASHVAFRSFATNLVAGGVDVNGDADVFLLDRASGVVALVSHAAGAPQVAANGRSEGISLTGDGLRVAYYSRATDVVPGQVDGNAGSDLFLYDAATGTNRLVSHVAGSSVTAANAPTPSPLVFEARPGTVSDDGRYVAFATEASDIVAGAVPRLSAYLFDAATDSAQWVSRSPQGAQAGPDGSAHDPTLSANGNFVAFSDSAADMVDGDFNGVSDAFLFGPVHLSTDLASSLADSADPVSTGETLGYTIAITNQGATPATGVVLTDTLPAGVSFQSSLPGPPTCVESGGTLSCALGNLAALATVSVSIDTMVTLDSGILTNTARVTAAEPDADPSNDAVVEATLVDPAELALSMDAPAGPVPPLAPYAYLLSVTNQGPADASAVTVVDALPAGLAFLSSTPGPPACQEAGGTVTCGLGTLAAAASVQVTIDVQPSAHTSVTNSAAVSAASHDSDLTNNAASATTAIAVGIDLELVHGSVLGRTLAALPGPVAREDLFRLARPGRSSWEVLVDGTSADISGAGTIVSLERLAADVATSLQAGESVGAGHSAGMRMENVSAAAVLDEVIRVRSTGCSVDCGPEDVYRIRARETTAAVARFNNSATQSTVLLLENREGDPVAGHIWFWAGAGDLLGSRSFVLDPHATLALPTTTVMGVADASGSITITHGGGYGAISGKAVAVEPATGFTFDTPLVDRMR